MPLASFIIITRDRPEHIGQAIAAVQAQTEPRHELLILDDSRDEATRRVLRRQRDPRLRYLHVSPPMEFYPAAEAALKLARGEFVAFLGDDDWVSPNYLQALLATIREDPRSGAAYPYNARFDPQGRQHTAMKPDYPRHIRGGLWAFIEFLHTPPAERHSRMWGLARRDLLAQAFALGYPTVQVRYALGRDFLFLLYLLIKGPVGIAYEARYHFLMHPGQNGRDLKRGPLGLLPARRFSEADHLVGYGALLDKVGELLDGPHCARLPLRERLVFHYLLRQWILNTNLRRAILGTNDYPQALERVGLDQEAAALREWFALQRVQGVPLLRRVAQAG